MHRAPKQSSMYRTGYDEFGGGGASGVEWMCWFHSWMAHWSELVRLVFDVMNIFAHVPSLMTCLQKYYARN